MMGIILWEKFRLIEKPKSDDTILWKGTHIILLCMAFLFGGFCSFFFHVLMYMFEGRCILFPNLQPLNSMPSHTFEFTSDEQAILSRSINFITTSWLDSKACTMPIYLPLLSSISGLVWTAMFLMSESGYQVVTGFQRSWWVLPFNFIFSLIMGCLCFYTSVITHRGLNELCNKIGEINGHSSCQIGLTLVRGLFEKRILGVYRVITITILTSWLNTFAWILSTLLIIIRVCLVSDFQLVKVTVELRGDFEKILDEYETQIRSITPTITNESPQHYYRRSIFDEAINPIRRTRSAPLRLYTEETDKSSSLKSNSETKSVHFAENYIQAIIDSVVPSNTTLNSLKMEPKQKTSYEYFKEYLLEITDSALNSNSFKLQRINSEVNLIEKNLEKNTSSNDGQEVDEGKPSDYADESSDASSKHSESNRKKLKKKVKIQSKTRMIMDPKDSSSESSYEEKPTTSKK